ncbi:MAG: LPS assembly protein LptD [Pseudomonadota bacterium]
MTGWRGRLLGAALALSLAGAAPLAAQSRFDLPEENAPATLLADEVAIDAEGRLVATGNVEALQGNARLTASKVIYDREADALEIEGPIVLTTDDRTLVLASAAEISPSLRDGLLRSARVVLDSRVQLAAPEINRVGGRYLQLNNVVASSCEVCGKNPVPLWQIRARRVINDELEQQLYFDDARFEVYGVPVFYLPRLRLPGPGLERATGFLVPQFTSSSEIGQGVKLPYFIALDPSYDLLLTPHVTTGPTATLEARYRHVFRSGQLQFDGALSRDDLRPGETRGYLFGAGAFTLPRNYRLRFDVEAASDSAYLDDYDITGKDRLDSAIALTRGRRDQWFGAETIYFNVPGADLSNEIRPTLLADIEWARRFTPAGLGGVGTFELTAHGHERPSEADVIGRDVARVTARLGWRGDRIGPAGLVFAGEAGALAEYTNFGDDSTAPDPELRLIPAAAVELRWPWARAGARGASHLIEPVAQLVWTPDDAVAERPTEESVQLELDAGNLFALSRFPAYDEVEAGLRANLGIGYTFANPDGWSFGVTAGRVVRAEDLGQFDGYAAFEGTVSDWMLGVDLALNESLSFSTRSLFDDDLSADRVETRLGWSSDKLDLAGSYAWLAASPAEERRQVINQWRFDGAYRVNERWRASADVSYDLTLERRAEAEIGVEYRTECITLDFGWRQRFTSATQENPSEGFTFEIALAGFGGTDDGPRPRPRRCIR